jgi:bacterioferritin (cytochrome b1)
VPIEDTVGAMTLLLQILKMEEGYADGADMQRAQIEQMGLQNYLANQTAGASQA